jgi:uncharacterized protein with NRDE domain
MCLVLLALDSHPDHHLIVAANRDEFYDRPTAPADFWYDASGVLGGRDLQARGTWLGVTREGRFAAVTNYRQGTREPTATRSRGLLVSDFLTGNTSGLEYMERVERDAALYNGFNLLAGDSAGVFYYSNREGRMRSLSSGVYGLSNHLLDTPWPKVAATKSAFGAILNGGGPELITDLFHLLSNRDRARDDDLPSTGVGPEWERLLSSAFIASEDYGTRSSTVVLVSQPGSMVFVERSFGRGGLPGAEVRFELGGKRPGRTVDERA